MTPNSTPKAAPQEGPTEDETVYMALPTDGYPEAIERVTFTSAPLLAGFAITFIGLILGSDVSMYMPNTTLAGLTAAAMLLIYSVQLAFTGRGNYLPYSDFKDRLELLGEPGDPARSAARERYVKSLSGYHALMTWAGRLYNAGVVIFLFAVATALIPADTTGSIDTERVVAIAIAGLTGVVEIVWALSNEIVAWQERRR